LKCNKFLFSFKYIAITYFIHLNTAKVFKAINYNLSHLWGKLWTEMRICVPSILLMPKVNERTNWRSTLSSFLCYGSNEFIHSSQNGATATTTSINVFWSVSFLYPCWGYFNFVNNCVVY